jgi:hypothetical protein
MPENDTSRIITAIIYPRGGTRGLPVNERKEAMRIPQQARMRKNRSGEMICPQYWRPLSRKGCELELLLVLIQKRGSWV